MYTVDGKRLAGFASRKNRVMLYIMVHEVVDRYADQLGELWTGKSCIELKATKSLTLDDLKKLARKMLADAKKATTEHGVTEGTSTCYDTRSSGRNGWRRWKASVKNGTMRRRRSPAVS